MLNTSKTIKYILLLIVAFSLCHCGQQEREIPAAKKTAKTKKTKKTLKKAPDFTLKKVIDGERISLSQFSGKVVLLDFWATWCPPCKASIPNMNNLYKKYNDKGLEIIGISVDLIREINDEQKVKDFINKYSMEYPVVYVTQRMRAKYGGITSVPTVFIINREGMIVSKIQGYSPALEKKMEKTIRKLL